MTDTKRIEAARRRDTLVVESINSCLVGYAQRRDGEWMWFCEGIATSADERPNRYWWETRDMALADARTRRPTWRTYRVVPA